MNPTRKPHSKKLSKKVQIKEVVVMQLSEWDKEFQNKVKAIEILSKKFYIQIINLNLF